MEARAAERTVRSQLEAAECEITALKRQLIDAELSLEKSAGEMSKTEADL